MLPRVNTNLDAIQHQVASWQLAFSSAGHVEREVALDRDGQVLFAAPTESNYGFWRDTNMRIEDFVAPKLVCRKITAAVFEHSFQRYCEDARRSNIIGELNESFATISRRLSANSLNYVADFRLCRCHRMAGASLDAVVQVALGEGARVGGSCAATKEEVIETLNSALRHQGDDGSHPGRSYLASPKSEEDFHSVVSGVSEILDQTDSIVSFWLKSGHPFYPVFWDFAFLIEAAEHSILFIASSSD